VTGTREERSRKAKVGVFVLVSLAAFLGLIYALGARSRLFEPRFTVHADFTEVGGLAEGATVRLAGVQIGRVTGVHLPRQPGGKVRIDLNIASQFGDRVRKDSVARIDTQGLLGDKIIEVTVGTAQAPPARPGDVLASRDPTDIGKIIDQGAATVTNVAALAASLGALSQELAQSKIIEDATALVASSRKTVEQAGRDVADVTRGAKRVTDQAARIVDRVEKGPGLAHTLVYEEPVQLAKVNELLASTQQILDRAGRGEGAVGVLTSEQSTAAARRLVAAIDRFASQMDRPPAEQGLLLEALFDPKYRGILDDAAVVAHNFRAVSERIAGGRGTIGGLVKDEGPSAGIQQTSRDLQATLANLKSITDKINEGEGTMGLLVTDPTLYERVVSLLDNAKRSILLRFLLRGLATRDKDGGQDSAAPPDKKP
jgi:phospholipid/cholesterol/gamma-HCH transport system substrate-binding protein